MPVHRSVAQCIAFQWQSRNRQACRAAEYATLPENIEMLLVDIIVDLLESYTRMFIYIYIFFFNLVSNKICVWSSALIIFCFCFYESERNEFRNQRRIAIYTWRYSSWLACFSISSHLNILLGMSPVSLRVQITQLHNFLLTETDLRHSTSDFASNEGFS